MPRIPKNEAIHRLLRDLHEQATRHKRATDEKRYLITDLEIIERVAQDLRDAINSKEEEVLYPAMKRDEKEAESLFL